MRPRHRRRTRQSWLRHSCSSLHESEAMPRQQQLRCQRRPAAARTPLDPLERVLHKGAALCYDHRNRLADETDLAAGEKRLRARLLDRRDRVAVARHRPPRGRHACKRQRRPEARQLRLSRCGQRACATGLRTNAAWSARGEGISSTNRPAPRTSRSSSRRGSAWPIAEFIPRALRLRARNQSGQAS